MPRLMEALGIFHDQHDRYEEAYTLRWIAIAQRAAGHDATPRADEFGFAGTSNGQTGKTLSQVRSHDEPSQDRDA